MQILLSYHYFIESVLICDTKYLADFRRISILFPYHKIGSSCERILNYAVSHLLNNERFPVERIVAAGKSMGGRIASQMVATDQMDVEALIFLGYPLHAPGRTNKLRDTHLYGIKKPMLFFTGTRDPLCNLEKLQEVYHRIRGLCDLEIVEGGDHSFKLPKSWPRSVDSVHRQIAEKCLQWLEPIAK